MESVTIHVMIHRSGYSTDERAKLDLTYFIAQIPKYKIPVLCVNEETKTQRLEPIGYKYFNFRDAGQTAISISWATQICSKVLVPNTYIYDIKCV